MAEGKPISKFAQRFVARTLEQFTKRAAEGSGLHYELFSQNFTDAVDRLAARMKRADLRAHLREHAESTGNYMGQEKHLGRWDYDHEQGDVLWRGEVPDAWRRVDFEGQWVRKSGDERARYVTGYFGEDSRTQNDYPGIQVEKDGVIGPIKWGPLQPDGQEAQEYAEQMLDRHLGFAAPKIQPASIKDIMRRQELSEQLGAKVLSKEYKKYIKECAVPRKSSAQKYGGASDSGESELPPPRRSR